VANHPWDVSALVSSCLNKEVVHDFSNHVAIHIMSSLHTIWNFRVLIARVLCRRAYPWSASDMVDDLTYPPAVVSVGDSDKFASSLTRNAIPKFRPNIYPMGWG
jgi:hypothetical protein